LLTALEALLVDETAGDPMTGLKWTHKSLRKIQQSLQAQGYGVSRPTIRRLLRARKDSLWVNHKCEASQQSEGRDEQFAYLVRWRKACLRWQWPVISVDTKKVELVGNFKQAGRAWRNTKRRVNIYDFPSAAEGKAIPYGIYDVGRNPGYVVVGTSHDTPAFAVSAIRRWWLEAGRSAYRDQRHLLIECDCGGSNGNRRRLWKVGLQALSDEFGLIITVTHYPTGASKWNPIEHRMFNWISGNWAGRPLDSYETVVNYISTTSTETGFSCQAYLDATTYATGVKVSDEEFERLSLRPHKRFPKWNYTIYPRIENRSL
jgi:hypothetical protein